MREKNALLAPDLNTNLDIDGKPNSYKEIASDSHSHSPFIGENIKEYESYEIKKNIDDYFLVHPCNGISK